MRNNTNIDLRYAFASTHNSFASALLKRRSFFFENLELLPIARNNELEYC